MLQANASEESNPPCTWSRDGDAKPEMVIREEWAQRAMWERCAVFTAASTASRRMNMCCAFPWLEWRTFSA